MKSQKTAIVFLLFFSLLACNRIEQEKVAKSEEGIVESTAKSLEVKEEDSSSSSVSESGSNSIRTSGYIDVPPANKAALSPYYGGYVKEIFVLVGQTVKKGETLVRLQNPEYLKLQQEYLEAKEQIEYLKADFERQTTLLEEKISSSKELKKSESDYKVMLARYNSLQDQIKLMGVSISEIEAGNLTSIISIQAPFNGSITDVNVVLGQYADAKMNLLGLINRDHLHLELEVFEQDAMGIQEDQKIQFRIPELGREMYEGEVHMIGKSIDPVKRTVKVHGHILSEDQGWLPGMFVEAEILK